jgi:hypothetical protein
VVISTISPDVKFFLLNCEIGLSQICETPLQGEMVELNGIGQNWDLFALLKFTQFMT